MGQQTTKSFKDYGALIEGSYLGVGHLTKGNETIESYQDIKVILHRLERNTVSVNVEESNGEKYFPEDGTYIINKQTDGSYLLTLDKISSAIIRIDKDKKIEYIHPKVNIDGDIYTLTINGRIK